MKNFKGNIIFSTLVFQCKEWTSQESGISESLHGGTTQEVIHYNTNS